MPSVRLTIIVRLDQAASLDRLEDLREERRTPIGTDVSVLLSAAGGLAATKLFSDLGALAIPFEATAAIGDIHYLCSVLARPRRPRAADHRTPPNGKNRPDRPEASQMRTIPANLCLF